MFDEAAVDVELNNPDEELDYNALVDEFGEENVTLANYYLHRYKLLKLVPDVLDLDDDDVFVFLVLEEEFGVKQAAEAMKMKEQSKRR